MDYLEDLYEQFLKDPQSVSGQWQDYFTQLRQQSEMIAPADVSHAQIRQQFLQYAQQPHKRSAVTADGAMVRKQAAVDRLIQAYRTYGYLVADINPLPGYINPRPVQLELSHYPDLSTADYDRLFYDHSTAVDTLLGGEPASLRAIIAKLQRIYCGHLAVEYTYIRESTELQWLQQRLESEQSLFSPEEKRELLKQLTAAEGLEKYLAHRYVGQKRFSLEGGDSFIPLVHALNEQAAARGVKEISVGMAHRGRLNMLINIFGKPPEELFQEFEGRKDYGLTSGDVKYHLGYASDIDTKSGSLHLSLAFNPSHLEFVCPVIMGSVRARQHMRVRGSEQQVLALMVHGDASFAGQGVVMETLNMSQTHAYKIDGALHVVINNQVGFTTSDPNDARSSLYCTDLAKMIDAPVLHVNGDDPEAVVIAACLAVDYRAQFGKDIFINLICYRRFGHNEADEPAATQPQMYRFIRQHLTPRELYAQQLITENVYTQTQVDALVEEYRAALDAGASVVKLKPDGLAYRYIADWKPYMEQEWFTPADTTVPKNKIIELGKKLQVLPAGFELQRQVGHIMAARAKMTSAELPVDWGYAETMAFATLLDEGYAIRLSGQDCERGTFAHRHAVLHEQQTNETYTPLAHLGEKQASLQIYDSLLSETGAMGFEYGYASTDPSTLVLWEAQYGDFANGAQVIIDQFISSAWQKWRTLAGITLLLPHGYEGGGPEHSSARLERFLQLCAQENIQVCVPTTPAQIFHLLRRQIVRLYRTPLIVMTPKSLLRHKLAVSSLEELSQGHFQLIIPEIDDVIDSEKTTRVILCSGKVYYDLLVQRREQQLNHIAIVRIEQLYPFPHEDLQSELKRYASAKEVVWCQEEPENQGAWYTTRHRLEACLAPEQKLHYAGRVASASPAAGYMKLHVKQQNELINDALHPKNP